MCPFREEEEDSGQTVAILPDIWSNSAEIFASAACRTTNDSMCDRSILQTASVGVIGQMTTTVTWVLSRSKSLSSR